MSKRYEALAELVKYYYRKEADIDETLDIFENLLFEVRNEFEKHFPCTLDLFPEDSKLSGFEKPDPNKPEVHRNVTEVLIRIIQKAKILNVERNKFSNDYHNMKREFDLLKEERDEATQERNKEIDLLEKQISEYDKLSCNTRLIKRAELAEAEIERLEGIIIEMQQVANKMRNK